MNRIVFHTSAHQPLDTKPGNTMVGTHLHRNITWAEQAAPFVTYLARSSLHAAAGAIRGGHRISAQRRRALHAADLGRRHEPTPPEGYDYDFINADVLLNRMTVADDGRSCCPTA